MKKILFLLDELPPTKSANGICIDKVIRSLRQSGVESSCICWSAPSNYQCSVHLIQKKPWMKISSAFDNTNFLKKIAFLFLRVLYKIKRIFLFPFWPVDSLETVNRFYKEAKKIIKDEKIGVVVAVNFPGETLVAMKRLKKCFGEEIVTVMYPLDVSFENPSCSKLGRYFSRAFCSTFMRGCAKRADYVLALENAIDIFYKKINCKKKIVACGIPALSIYIKESSGIVGNKINFLYAGKIQSNLRNPEIILHSLNASAYLTSKKITFTFCGDMDTYAKKVFSDGDCEFVLNDFGWVEEDMLDEIIKKSDILISTGNSDPNLIPSKLFKYMSTGKPIIHFCYTDSDPCIAYLKKYDNAYIIRNFEDDVIRKSDNFKYFLLNRHLAGIDLKSTFPRCFPEYTSNFLKSLL